MVTYCGSGQFRSYFESITSYGFENVQLRSQAKLIGQQGKGMLSACSTPFSTSKPVTCLRITLIHFCSCWAWCCSKSACAGRPKPRQRAAASSRNMPATSCKKLLERISAQCSLLLRGPFGDFFSPYWALLRAPGRSFCFGRVLYRGRAD